MAASRVRNGASRPQAWSVGCQTCPTTGRTSPTIQPSRLLRDPTSIRQSTTPFRHDLQYECEFQRFTNVGFLSCSSASKLGVAQSYPCAKRLRRPTHVSHRLCLPPPPLAFALSLKQSTGNNDSITAGCEGNPVHCRPPPVQDLGRWCGFLCGLNATTGPQKVR